MSYVGRKPYFLQARIDELAIKFTNNASPGALDNVAVSTSSYVRFSNATSISGFVVPNLPVNDGKILIITNSSANPITIFNESTNSNSSNRIITGTGGDITLKAAASIELVYDLFSNRWRIIGGTGGGSGLSRIRLVDTTATTLPTGTVTVDGVGVNEGDLVLFVNLSSNNNQVYKANGSGATITSWTAQTIFQETTSVVPGNGDTIYIQEGDIYKENYLFFNGTEWKNMLNNKVQQTLSDNVTDQNLIYLNAADTENIVMEYSISRDTTREVGTFYACHNGTTAQSSTAGSGVGSTGVSFDAVIVGTYFVIRYTSTSTGIAPVLKRSLRVW